jgi:uncharacterized protein (TIGR00725 family)
MQIAVIGAARCSDDEEAAAVRVGRAIATGGAVLLCGGNGGVMEAASRGAAGCGGLVIGILPDTGDGNPYLSVAIRTGLGHARNVVLVQSADAVVAVGGSYGTLSEIAIAAKTKKEVFGYRTWDLPCVIRCEGPEEAVDGALHAARRSPRSGIPPSG